MAFKQSENEQAYLKAGLMGFAGAGKTYTAKELAIGLHLHCIKNGTRQQGDPVYFLDTETGSDWVQKDFQDAGIPLLVDKVVAFASLVPSIKEVAEHKGILIIDSITHFWKELTESYARERRRTSLTFADWGWIKQKWGEFTRMFVNSPCHIIMCGRAGFEYDFFEDEAGKKELAKTGIRMKAEGETGYEPSILVLMERKQELLPKGGLVVSHTGYIVKDRGNVIDGKVFQNPKFEDFLPHIERLNLGGSHVGVDDSVTSGGIIPADNRAWQAMEEEKNAVLDEVKCYLIKEHPASTPKAKVAQADILERWFGTRSWERVKMRNLNELKEGMRNMIQQQQVE